MHLRRAQRTLCAAALLLAISPIGGADAASAITEYPLTPRDSGPAGIIAGPDGNLWYSETSAARLGVATAAGTATQITGLRGPAGGLTTGPDGNVWVTEPHAQVIARVTPSHVVTEYTLPGGTDPEQITAGSDGNLWFTQAAGSGWIGQITPAGAITQFSTGLTHNSAPTGIAAGPDGNVWFTESAGPGRIGRITPAGTITEFATPTVNSDPTSITTGPDGNLWFTESAGPGRIGRITPTGTITEFAIPTTNGRPASITSGPDGNLYFTEPADPGQIGRITPAGTITELPTPTANSKPASITTGPDGRMWFTEPGSHGLLGAMTISAASSPAPPSVTAFAANGVGAMSARLTGLVDPNGMATTYRFTWGTTTAYGQSAPLAAAAVGSDATEHPVVQMLKGLSPRTVYHFRLIASNCDGCAAGTTASPDATFITNGAPGTVVAGGPVAAPPAPPRFGHTAVATVRSGTVLVRLPGSTTLVPLAAAADIPLGALVDTSHGAVAITTALDTQGATQTATTWGGAFVLRQRPHSGMVTFTLAGALGCPARRAAKETVALATRPGRHRPKRRLLWSSDNHGQYTTRGQNSVATVRGTVWETIDTCGATTTFVKRGRVSVRDLHRHRTVLVTAGHRYLARAR